MLTVEGREQVLLKVSVVEMERNIIKQFGVDLGALINSGSFAFAALSKLPFPINTQGGGIIAPFIPNPAAEPIRVVWEPPPASVRVWPAAASNGCRGRIVCRRFCVLLNKMVCCTPWPSRI